MAIELIDKIKPKNNQTFALVDAEDIQVDSEGTRLTSKIAELDNLIHSKPIFSHISSDTERPLQLVNTGDPIYLTFNLSASIFGSYSVAIDRASYSDDSFLRIMETQTTSTEPSIRIGLSEASGDYIYKVSATDRLGNAAKTISDSNYLYFRVIMGSIKFESSFTSNLDNSLLSTDTTSITYPISVIPNSGGSMKMLYRISADKSGEWYEGKFESGASEIAVNSGIQVNQNCSLSFSKLAAGNYFLETKIQLDVIDEGTTITSYSSVLVSDIAVMQTNSIEVRISALPQFYTSDYINIKFTTITNNINYQYGNPIGISYEIRDPENTLVTSGSFDTYHRATSSINVGKISLIGNYSVKIIASAASMRAERQATFEVLESVGEGSKAIEENLLFEFFATNGFNNNDWIPYKQAEGFNFHISTTNMISNPLSEDGNMIFSSNNSGVLKNGEALYNPFAVFYDENTKGITLEAYVKSKCIGELNSKIICCQEVKSDTSVLSFGSSISYNEARIDSKDMIHKYPLLEDKLQHIALVINCDVSNTSKKFEDLNPYYSGRVYINGVLSKMDKIINKPSLTPSDLGNLFPFIINGSSKNSISNSQGNLVIENKGYSEINTIRVYSKALTSSEVYNNYLNCLPESQRVAIKEKNDTSLSKVVFVKNREESINDADKSFWQKKNLKNETFEVLNKITEKKLDKTDDPATTNKRVSKNTLVNCTLWYSNGLIDDSGAESFSSIPNVDVFLQGTSSLVYPVKNYQIKTYTTSGNSRSSNKIYPPVIQQEDQSQWLPDSIFTLKCDYMEQSHRNNTPTACYYEDYVLPAVIQQLHPTETDLTQYYSFPKRFNQEKPYRDAINGYPCVVYFYDNLTDVDINTSFQFNADLFTLAGSYMFNIDKEGAQLGFEFSDPQGKEYNCVSYEGSANADYSAGAFLPYDAYNEFLATPEGQSLKLPSYDTEIDYIAATLEPRFSYLEDDDRQYSKIKRAIEWVYDTPVTSQDANGATIYPFKDEFRNYFSYEYCMAYYLQLTVFAQVDNAGKNAMFDYWCYGTPDSDGICEEESVLYPRPYDMDTQMGEENTGKDKVPASVEINPIFSPTAVTGSVVSDPTTYVPSYLSITSIDHPRYEDYNTKNSQLWSKFATAFRSEIQSCYEALRKSGQVYTLDRILPQISKLTSDKIGEKLYNSDAVSKYINILDENSAYSDTRLYALQGNRANRYEQYLSDRLTFLDTYFGITNGLNTTATFRAYEVGTHPIGIKVYTPQYVTFIVGTSELTATIYCDPSDTYEIDGTLYNGTLINIPITGGNKEIIIKGVGNIQALDHFDALRCGIYDIRNATKLTELNLANNTTLTELVLGNNEYFRYIDLSGVTRLTKPIDVSGCVNLTSINLSNSSIPSLEIPENSSITKLNLKNSKITNLKLVGSSVLTLNGDNPSLDISGCNSLQSIHIENCDAITTLNLSVFPELKNITLKDNANLRSINLSGLEIASLTLSGSALEYIDASNCSGYVFDNLIDWSHLSGLKSLNLNSSGNNSGHIRLPINQYDSLDLSSCKVQIFSTIQSAQDEINIGDYNFTGITFNPKVSNTKPLRISSNTEIIRAVGLNVYQHLDSLFSYCSNLAHVKDSNFTYYLNNGESVQYSIASMFYYCEALEDFDAVEFENLEWVQSASACFYQARKLKLASARNLLNELINCENLSSFLYGACRTEEADLIPIDIFSNNCAITSLNSFFRSSGFKRIQKYDTTAPSFDRNMREITSLFSPCSNSLQELSSCFKDCINLEYVPYDILHPLTALTSIRCIFKGCTKLGTIHDDIEEDCILSYSLDVFPIVTNNSGDRVSNNLTDVAAAFGSCNLVSRNIDFTTDDYEQSLINLFKYSQNLQYIDAMFLGCKSLNPPICKGLLNHNTNLIYADFAFLNSGLECELPKIFNGTNTLSNLISSCGMFANNVNLTGTVSSDFFINTPNLKRIGKAEHGPANEPSYPTTNTYVDNTTAASPGMFADTGIESFEIKALRPLTALEDCSMLFTKTARDTSGNVTYGFRNSTTALTLKISLDATISLIDEGSEITVIGSELLENCVNLRNASYMLAGCTNLEKIYINDLFRNVTNIQNISGMFMNCENLTTITLSDGYEHLFNNLTNLTNVSQLFCNCENIEFDIEEIQLFNNCPSIQNCSAMFMKTAIQGSISNKLFDSCRDSLRNTSYMFADCLGLNGVIKTGYSTISGWQEDLDPDTGEPISEGQAILTIEELGLLSKCYNLNDVQYMFCNCSNLTGPIPADMFYSDKDYLNLTSLNSLFESCDKLGLDNIELETQNKPSSIKVFDHVNTIKLDLEERSKDGARNYQSIYPNIRREKIEGSEDYNYIIDDDLRYFIPQDWLSRCKNVQTLNYIFCNVGHVRKLPNDDIILGSLIPLLELPNDVFSNMKNITSATYAFAYMPILGRTMLNSNFMKSSLNKLISIRGIFAFSKLKSAGASENNTAFYKATTNRTLKDVGYAFINFNKDSYRIDSNGEINFANTYFSEYLNDDQDYIYPSSYVTDNYGPKFADQKAFSAITTKTYCFSNAYNMKPYYNGSTVDNSYSAFVQHYGHATDTYTRRDLSTWIENITISLPKLT